MSWTSQCGVKYPSPGLYFCILYPREAVQAARCLSTSLYSLLYFSTKILSFFTKVFDVYESSSS